MIRSMLKTQINSRLKAEIKRHCESKGLDMSRFIEEALLDKLEDSEDIEKIIGEPTRPLEDIIRDFERNGLL